jgi:hypothetical protein
MKYLAITAAIILACHLAYVAPAHGHGFVLYLSGDKIVAESDDNNSLHNGQFDGGYQELSGFKALIGGGLTVPADTFTLELFGPLWFSDGGPAVLAGAGIDLTAESYADGSFNVLLGSAIRSAQSIGSATMAIPGNDDDSMIFSLAGMSITPGVYGIGMKVHGLNEGNPLTPFESSDPVVMTFRTQGFSQGNSVTLGEAQAAVFVAAVPEPRGLLLALVAAGSIAACLLVRRLRYPLPGRADCRCGRRGPWPSALRLRP